MHHGSHYELYYKALEFFSIGPSPMLNKRLSYYSRMQLILLCMFLFIPTVTQAQTSLTQKSTLKTIAYLESSTYWEYTRIYLETLAKLKELGLQDQLSFPADLYISQDKKASKEDLRKEAAALMANPRVDLILSMGTAATSALLLENNNTTPIIAFAVSDPIGMGFIDQETGKAAPNLTIHYIKNQWNILFRTLSSALSVKKLGIMYNDTQEGRTYSNVTAAREVGREQGFTLIEYPYIDAEESTESCTRGIDALIKAGIDTFYVPSLNGFDWDNKDPRPLIKKLHSHGVKTFAQEGSIQVKHGILMGLALTNTQSLARFYAYKIGEKLQLLPPKNLTNDTIKTPTFTINLVAAKTLNLDFPLSLLVATDEIFDDTLPEVKPIITDY